MRKLRLILLALVGLLSSQMTEAQRVSAYHQWFNTNKIQSWYWDQVTDVNASFLQVNANGGLGFGVGGAADAFQEAQFNNFIAVAKQNGKKIFISIGGASELQALNFRNISQNQARCNTFADNVVNFCNTYGLDGIDVDWEPFSTNPTTQPTPAEWDRLIKAVHDRIVVYEQGGGRNLELTAAVFPWEFNNSHVTTSCYQYFDHLNLMVYDFGGPGWQNHSLNVPGNNFTSGGKYRGWDIEAACIDYWNVTKGLPKSKMVLGLPFYGRSAEWSFNANDFRNYRDILASDASANTKNSSSGWQYNGQSTINRKTTYALDNGLKGVFFWEWTGDGTNESTSLQKEVTAAIDATGGCARPDLGDEQVICGVQDIDLNAGVSASEYTFEWFKDGTKINGASSVDYTADAPGTYRVVITSTTNPCSRESAVLISDQYGDIPPLDDASLCGSTAYDGDATINGFENLNYSWSDGTNGPVISVTTPGTYTVTVSDPFGHCADKTSSFTASENTVNVSVDPVCNASDDAHYVISGPGNFSWYTAETGGNLLGNEAELYRRQDLGAVWIQKTGGATNYTVGLPYDNEAPDDEFSGPGNGDYNSAGTADARLQFDVKQNLTITQFTARIASTGDLDVVIYDENENVFLTETVNLEFEGLVDVPVSFELPPGRYFLGMPDAQQWAQKNPTFGQDIGYGSFGGPAGSMDLDGVIDFISTNCKCENDYGLDIVNWYAGFYDIQVSTGQVCPRVSAEATVDPSVCLGVSVLINEPGDNASFGFNEDVTISAEVIDDDGGSLTSVVATINGQTINLTNTTGNTYTGNWNTGTTTLTDEDLTVTGTNSNSVTGSNSVKVNVANNNQDPTATLSANPNTNIVEGDIVDITFGGTDPDGDNLNVTIELNGTTQSWSSVYQWTAVAGTNVISVTVDDGNGGTDTEQITLTVATDNPPTADLTVNPNTNVVAGDELTVSFGGTDAEGPLAGTSIRLNNVAQSWTSPYTWTAVEGVNTFELTVTDSKGQTDVETVVVNVAANQDPIITLDASATTGVKDDVITFTWSAVDPEGDLSSVEISLDGSTQNWTSPHDWTATTGQHIIQVTAVDGFGNVVSDDITVNITDPLNNAPTVTLTVSPTTGVETGDLVTISWVSDDTDGNVVSEDLLINGQTVSISNGGTWIAEEGNNTISITVTDDKGATSSDQETVTVTTPINQDPTVSLSVLPNTNVKTGDPVTISWISDDNDGNVVSEVLTINGQSVSVSNGGTWVAELGSNVIRILVTDDQGATAFDEVVVSVSDPNNDNPVVNLTLSPSSNIQVGDQVTVSWTATDDGSIASEVLEINRQTSSIANGGIWIATAGQNTFRVTATDDKGANAFDQVSINVTSGGGNDNEATITFVSPTNGETVGTIAYEVVAEVSDIDGLSTVQLKVVDPNATFPFNQPSYYTLTDDGTGTFSGTWNPITNTNFVLSIVSTDQNGGTTESGTISVTVDSDFGVGLDDDLDPFKLSMVVYPNPAQDNAMIDFNIQNSGSGNLALYDLSGNLVKEISNGAFSSGIQSSNINIEELTSGVYVIKLTVDGEYIVRKFVKE